jgi:hypothetical protein
MSKSCHVESCRVEELPCRRAAMSKAAMPCQKSPEVSDHGCTRRAPKWSGEAYHISVAVMASTLLQVHDRGTNQQP